MRVARGPSRNSPSGRATVTRKPTRTYDMYDSTAITLGRNFAVAANTTEAFTTTTMDRGGASDDEVNHDPNPPAAAARRLDPSLPRYRGSSPVPGVGSGPLPRTRPAARRPSSERVAKVVPRPKRPSRFKREGAEATRSPAQKPPVADRPARPGRRSVSKSASRPASATRAKPTGDQRPKSRPKARPKRVSKAKAAEGRSPASSPARPSRVDQFWDKVETEADRRTLAVAESGPVQAPRPKVARPPRSKGRRPKSKASPRGSRPKSKASSPRPKVARPPRSKGRRPPKTKSKASGSPKMRAPRSSKPRKGPPVGQSTSQPLVAGRERSPSGAVAVAMRAVTGGRPRRQRSYGLDSSSALEEQARAQRFSNGGADGERPRRNSRTWTVKTAIIPGDQSRPVRSRTSTITTDDGYSSSGDGKGGGSVRQRVNTPPRLHKPPAPDRAGTPIRANKYRSWSDVDRDDSSDGTHSPRVVRRRGAVDNLTLSGSSDGDGFGSEDGDRGPWLPAEESGDGGNTRRQVRVNWTNLTHGVHENDMDKSAMALANMVSLKGDRWMEHLAKTAREGRDSGADLENVEANFELADFRKTMVCDYNFDIPDGADVIVFGEQSGRSRRIKAATVEKLVERLTYSRKPDPDFISTFLLTYRSFMTPMELCEMLIRRFNMDPPPNSTYDERLAFLSTTMVPIRLRVFNVVKNWIDQHWYDFEEDTALLGRLLEFVEICFPSTGLEKAALQVRRAVIQQQEGLGGAVISYDNKPPKPKLAADIAAWNVVLKDVPPEEIARQLALIDFELYARIQAHECLNQAWTKKEVRPSPAPHIRAMIAHFNTTSAWVATEIVTAETGRRKATLTKFIQAASKCRAIGNFNGMMTVLSALQSTPVHRLKSLWSSLSSRVRSSFNTMVGLTENRFAGVRSELTSMEPPCIPYLGMYLTELTFLEDGNADEVEGGLVNFFKRERVAQVIKAIQSFQKTPYFFVRIPGLVQYISEYAVLDEEALYAASLEVEPRS